LLWEFAFASRASVVCWLYSFVLALKGLKKEKKIEKSSKIKLTLRLGRDRT